MNDPNYIGEEYKRAPPPIEHCSYVHNISKTHKNCAVTSYLGGLYTREFTKRVREMSSQLFATLYILSTYPYVHKQLRRTFFVNSPLGVLIQYMYVINN